MIKIEKLNLKQKHFVQIPQRTSFKTFACMFMTLNEKKIIQLQEKQVNRQHIKRV